MCRLLSDAEYRSILNINVLYESGNDRATWLGKVTDSVSQRKEELCPGAKIKKTPEPQYRST